MSSVIERLNDKELSLVSVFAPHPTDYPEANNLMSALLSGVQTILVKHFIGLYILGSLAGGDFNPLNSDIDFVVVTDNALSEEILKDLEAMHTRIIKSSLKWAEKLEGSYIPKAALRRYDPFDTEYPAFWDGRIALGKHGSDWVIQRHILREKGVVVAGPIPKSLIDQVSPKEIMWAAKETLHEWWSPQLCNTVRLRSSEYQAYAILTMCRALYTLEYGTIVSKPTAAHWAQAVLDKRWALLIEWAIAGRDDLQSGNMNEVLNFIRYTLDRSR